MPKKKKKKKQQEKKVSAPPANRIQPELVEGVEAFLKKHAEFLDPAAPSMVELFSADGTFRAVSRRAHDIMDMTISFHAQVVAFHATRDQPTMDPEETQDEATATETETTDNEEVGETSTVVAESKGQADAVKATAGKESEDSNDTTDPAVTNDAETIDAGSVDPVALIGSMSAVDVKRAAAWFGTFQWANLTHDHMVLLIAGFQNSDPDRYDDQDEELAIIFDAMTIVEGLTTLSAAPSSNDTESSSHTPENASENSQLATASGILDQETENADTAQEEADMPEID